MQSYFRLSASSRLRRPLSIFGLPEQYQKQQKRMYLTIWIRRLLRISVQKHTRNFRLF